MYTVNTILRYCYELFVLLGKSAESSWYRSRSYSKRHRVRFSRIAVSCCKPTQGRNSSLTYSLSGAARCFVTLIW